MNRSRNLLVLIMILTANFYNCNEKKEKNLNEYGEYLRLLQNTSSGNCAVIEKTETEAGKIVYNAQASVVGSGRCRENNFFSFSTNVEETISKVATYYNSMTLVFNNYSDCSEIVKTALAAREQITVTSISEGAKNSTTGCVKVVPKVYFCKDSESLTSLSNRYRYLSIANAKSDMRINYDSTVSINALTNKALDLKYEDVPLGNLRIASAAEIALFEGAESNSLVSATFQDAACFKKIILGNSTLKTAFSKIPTVQEFFKEEINVSDRKAVTETITPNLACRYGSEVTELPAIGTTATLGICPASYPVF